MTQIVAGEWKGHPLPKLKRGSVRPTTERGRTILFDTLFDLRNLRVLDLFSGTGALGFEALSRGAASLTSVDHDRRYMSRQADWALQHGINDRFRAICGEVPAILRDFMDSAFDLILADPPYDLEPNPSFLGDLERILSPSGTLVFERARRETEDLPFPRLTPVKEKTVAETRFTFYKAGAK